MKRWLFLMVPVVFLFSGGVAHSQQKLVPFKAAYAAPVPSVGHIWLAQDMDLFKKYGLDFELLYIRGSASAVQTLISGDIQAVFGTGAAGVSVTARGADVANIGTSGPTPYKLVAHESIKSIEGLKGKIIGISNFSGSDYFALRRLLPKLGLTPGKDVKLVAIGAPSGSAKMLVITQGRIDATLANRVDVLGYELKGQKFNMLADVVEQGIYVTSQDVLLTRSYMKRYPDRVKALLKGFIEGIHLTRKDKNLVFKAIRNHTKLRNETILEATYEDRFQETLKRKPYPMEAAVQFAIEDLSSNPELARLKTMKVADFIDTAPLQELEREGFFDKLGG